MNGEISYQGFSVKNVTEILNANPTSNAVALIVILAAFFGLAYFSINKTDKTHEQQMQQNSLRYTNPAEQRISGSLIGSSAHVRQRMFAHSHPDPSKQIIDNTSVENNAKVTQVR